MSPRPVPAREFVASFKRERALEAAARLVAAKGPHASKIGDLVKEAGIARKTFYEIFGSKQACLEAALAHSGNRIWLAANDGRSLEARLRSLLTFVADHPEHATLHLVHGPVISRLGFEINQGLFADLFAGAPDEDSATMLVGGIEWILRRHLTDSPGADPRLLLNGLRDFVVTHYRPGGAERLAAVA